MSDQVFAILRVDHSPSARSEVVVGYVHYEFDAKRVTDKLNEQTRSVHISRAIPCLTTIPGHC